MTDDVLVERRGAIQVITLNRPEARNALNRAVSIAVAAAVDELDESDELRVGVLTGAGGSFSAGMDLKAFAAGETPFVDGRGLCGITRTPPRKPMIAAVEGWAVAGGMEVALACDLVVAGADARFGVPEVTRGLVAAEGAALQLTRRLPYAIAMELLLTGAAISAERAAALGLVNRVVPAGTALAGALELAEVVAANGPFALVATKQVVRLGIDPAWAGQDEITAAVYASADAREGARAFAEKRAPRWTGR